MFDRGPTEVVQELNKLLAFNDMLLSLRNHPDAGNFARGIGPISLVGKVMLLLVCLFVLWIFSSHELSLVFH